MHVTCLTAGAGHLAAGCCRQGKPPLSSRIAGVALSVAQCMQAKLCQHKQLPSCWLQGGWQTCSHAEQGREGATAQGDAHPSAMPLKLAQLPSFCMENPGLALNSFAVPRHGQLHSCCQSATGPTPSRTPTNSTPTQITQMLESAKWSAMDSQRQHIVPFWQSCQLKPCCWLCSRLAPRSRSGA